MGTTTDRADPRLHKIDPRTGLQDAYLVLNGEERARGFVRPVRETYRHVGPVGPRYALVELTDEDRVRHAGRGYVRYEPYPDTQRPALGRYWTQAQLDAAGRGCGATTTMSRDIAETYAREPTFYGGTYCVRCRKHLPVAEFEWEPRAGERIDPDYRRLGS